jgi:hypothetical protein
LPHKCRRSAPAAPQRCVEVAFRALEERCEISYLLAVGDTPNEPSRLATGGIILYPGIGTGMGGLPNALFGACDAGRG